MSIYIVVNLKTLLKTKKELKIIKVTFISEPDGICGELKGFCLNKLLLSQASELTVGNLGGRCKPPSKVQEKGSEKTWKLMSPRQQGVTFSKS